MTQHRRTTYLSVCSGIEAATVAWHPLGWTPLAFAEIEPFANAVLSHHYPEVPNLGDFTKITRDSMSVYPTLVVGGTPCQDFSIAGLREGLAGIRGRLTIEFIKLLERIRPRWFVWENVPGVLSADKRRAFGIFLGAVAQCGYGFAYRVFDAQYFGVPQRRRRVFVVGYFGDWRPAAAVLFERESLSGHSAPSRETREEIAGALKSCSRSGGWSNSVDHAAGYMRVVPTIPAHRSGGGLGTDFDLDGGLISFSNTAGDTALSVDEHTALPLTNQHGDPGMIAKSVNIKPWRGEDHDTLIIQMQGSKSNLSAKSAIGFKPNQGSKSRSLSAQEEIAPTLESAMAGNNKPAVMYEMQVRRLTPRECERLQGFPDDYTLVPYRGRPAADGPRYRALGNSMAVPVMRWIGERIALIETLLKESNDLHHN